MPKFTDAGNAIIDSKKTNNSGVARILHQGGTGAGSEVRGDKVIQK